MPSCCSPGNHPHLSGTSCPSIALACHRDTGSRSRNPRASFGCGCNPWHNNSSQNSRSFQSRASWPLRCITPSHATPLTILPSSIEWEAQKDSQESPCNPPIGSCRQDTDVSLHCNAQSMDMSETHAHKHTHHRRQHPRHKKSLASLSLNKTLKGAQIGSHQWIHDARCVRTAERSRGRTALLTRTVARSAAPIPALHISCGTLHDVGTRCTLRNARSCVRAQTRPART